MAEISIVKYFDKPGTKMYPNRQDGKIAKESADKGDRLWKSVT